MCWGGGKRSGWNLLLDIGSRGCGGPVAFNGRIEDVDVELELDCVVDEGPGEGG